MHFRTKTGVAMLVAAVAALGGASSATAQEIDVAVADPISDCRQVTVGSIIQKLCVTVGTRRVISTSGTVTVAPYVTVSCPSPSVVSCSPVTVGVGRTGWQTNPAGPRPVLRPDGTVYMPAGNQGTFWVGGVPVPINTPTICVGSDSGCPGIV